MFVLFIRLIITFSCFIVLQLVYGFRQIRLPCEYELTFILTGFDSVMDYDDYLAAYLAVSPSAYPVDGATWL